MNVDGAWNNYEGLPRDFADRFDQVLSREGGYDVHLTGKQDFTEGSHTLNVRLGSWTKQVHFPYDLNQTGGWRYDYAEVCRSNGTVIPGNHSAHQGDWNVVEENVEWIASRSPDDDRPFFLYQGMNIVHPPYTTNKTYYDMIDAEKIEVPEWPELQDMHPCDLQSSMLKGCVPSYSERESVEDYYRKRNVRRIYYAMIAEFDAMVGRYIETVDKAGLSDNTVFILTSDHGDMQMEHRQTFKMTPYDASVSVPMVIYDPRRRSEPPVIVDDPTQLIDLFPTVLDLAGVPKSMVPDSVEGQSLLPLLQSKDARGERERWNRTHIVSQFHGINIAMSWFLIVKKKTKTDRTYKLIQYGTGNEVPPQLFELVSDPDEKVNLAHNSSHTRILSELDADLRSVVSYSDVAKDVASYDKQSFRCWMKNVDGNWREVIHNSNLRWTPSWNQDSADAFRALEEWLSTPDDTIRPCRSATKWPSKGGSDFGKEALIY